MSNGKDVTIRFGNVDPGSLSTLLALHDITNMIARTKGNGTNMEITLDDNGHGKRVFKFPTFGKWDMEIV